MQRARGGAEPPVLHNLGEGEEIVEVLHLDASGVLAQETVCSQSRSTRDFVSSPDLVRCDALAAPEPRMSARRPPNRSWTRTPHRNLVSCPSSGETPHVRASGVRRRGSS